MICIWSFSQALESSRKGSAADESRRPVFSSRRRIIVPSAECTTLSIHPLHKQGDIDRVHPTILVEIGDTDGAIAWLERGYSARDPLMITVKASPLFTPLRSDPRFQDLLHRIGFPES